MKQNSKKNFISCLALVLAVIMSLSSILAPIYAEEDVVFNISFDFTLENKAFATLSIQYNNTTKMFSVDYKEKSTSDFEISKSKKLNKSEHEFFLAIYDNWNESFDKSLEKARNNSLNVIGLVPEFIPELSNQIQNTMNINTGILGYTNFEIDKLRMKRESNRYNHRIKILPRFVEVFLDYDDNQEPIIEKVEYNSTVGYLPIKENKENVFVGWILSDNEQLLTPETKIKEGKYYIAMWKKIENSNESSNNPPIDSTPAPSPNPAPAPAPAPAPDNTDNTTIIENDTTPLGTIENTGTGNTTTTTTTTTTTNETEIVIEEDKTPLGAVKENNLAYLKGYNDKTVNPEGAVTREAAAAIFFRLMDKDMRNEMRSEENSFTDVKKTDWSNKHISTLVKAGILTGYTDGSFQPQKPITRAELASMLVKFYKLEAEKEHKFSDLKGNWAEEFIAALAKKGWVGGYPDGSFLPNKTVTRAELATIINNVLGRKIKKEELPKKLNKFSDLDAGKWYYEALILATTNYVSEKAEDGSQKFIETFEALVEM